MSFSYDVCIWTCIWFQTSLYGLCPLITARFRPNHQGRWPNPKTFTTPISLILNHFLIMSILWMLKLVSPVLCFQCVHSLIRFCDFFAVPQKLREIFARKSDHCQLWSRWDRRFRRRRRIPTNGPFSRYPCRCSRMSSMMMVVAQESSKTTKRNKSNWKLYPFDTAPQI